MNVFYCVKGFKQTYPISCTTPEAVRTFIRAAQANKLIAMFRAGCESVKVLMPSLIVGDHLAGRPLERRDVNYCYSTHRLLDYDHPCEPREIATLVATKLAEAGLGHIMQHIYMEESVSGKFHMLAPCLSDDPLTDIRAYGQFFGLQFDESVTNTSRLMALTGVELGGTALENLTLDTQSLDLSAILLSAADSTSCVAIPADSVSTDTTAPVAAASAPMCDLTTATYHGIPYTQIVESLIDELGGLPQVGERNSFAYRLAAEMKAITDCNPQWIATLIAEWDNFTLPPAEILSTVTSACRRRDDLRISPTLQRAINRALEKQGIIATVALSDCTTVRLPNLVADTHTAEPACQDDEDVDTPPSTTTAVWADVPPTMPEWDRLPLFVQTLCKNVPRHLVPHVLCQTEPALANHLCGTTFKDITNKLAQLGEGFLSFTIAPPATGKSSRREPIEAITRRFREQDAESRRLLDQWKDLARRTKASDLPEQPQVESHLLGADCTPSALLQKLKALPTGALLLMVDEIHQLDALKSNTADSHTPLILAFHSEMLEVERSSEVGVSGSVTMRLNLAAMGTPFKAERYFRNSWHDGLLTRCQFSTIITDDDYDDDDFLYGDYEGYQELVDPYIDLLVAKQGQRLLCPEADEHVRQLKRQALDLAYSSNSDSLRTLVRRQILLTQKRAYLYWVLAGCQWSESLQDFLTWRFWYNLFATYHVVGHIIESEQAASTASASAAAAAAKRGPQSWLQSLPVTFTKADLQHLRRLKGATCTDRDTSMQIATWKRRGFIVSHPEQPGTWIRQ